MEEYMVERSRSFVWSRRCAGYGAAKVLDRVPHLKVLLQESAEEDFSELRRAEATGRPLGAPEFVAGLESLLGRKIASRAFLAANQ